MTSTPTTRKVRVAIDGRVSSEPSVLRVSGPRRIQLAQDDELVAVGTTLRVPLALDYCLPEDVLARFQDASRAFTLFVECPDADPPVALCLHDPTQRATEYVANRLGGTPRGDAARGIAGRLRFALALSLDAPPGESPWHLHAALDEHLSNFLALTWPADDDGARETLVGIVL